jgi:hypothetical protein
MAIPWLIALRAIPWSAILSQAPAIASAADRLLSGTEDRKQARDLLSLTDRVAALERHNQADAQLLKQITDQVENLTTAAEVIAARVRWLLVLSTVSVILAVIAFGMALMRR